MYRTRALFGLLGWWAVAAAGTAALAAGADRGAAAAACLVECVDVGSASAGRVWREAEAFAATLPHGDVHVGRGDSMLPLFPDRTVIVVQKTPLSELRAGMTVVFVGDRGRPVAHTLVACSAGGWIAKGLGNREEDNTRVRRSNYIGQVIRAYLPDTGVPTAPSAAGQ